MTKWFHKRRKAFIALAGSLATWAITEFPDNHEVQLFAGLVTVLITGVVTHAVPNKPEGD